ncbi:hypothetical protein RclHR1_04830008 [Rhizophagus clarus]|uniref:Uncharacterized protein n=1 Tax=Rhizophagus clarus TaxID=94130 RepID=A0A2Z6S121_9GLOM|nr:hypothetical protein RclHR1_04830008 [Rhizophagus clarus]GES85988.1 hypothetical protein GLOIN_2v1697895 [Rhizophagus clarus]
MSDLTEIIATVCLLVGGFLIIFSTYIFGVCKNKNHNNFIMFNTLLITYDWIFYIIFNLWLWFFAADMFLNPPLFNLPVLFIMIFFNLLLTVFILRRELNNNEQFRTWFQEHKAFCIFIAFCSLGSLNVLHVLNCKFNYMDIFDAKLSFTAEKKIIHASVISLVLGDIPRLFLLGYLNMGLTDFYAVPTTSFFLTLLAINFGLFYRLYESMVRDYEIPAVQEFVISKKQFLEA